LILKYIKFTLFATDKGSVITIDNSVFAIIDGTEIFDRDSEEVSKKN
jgi:hypothetical protein